MADETVQDVEEQGGAPAAAPVAPGSGEVERRLAEVEGQNARMVQTLVQQYLNGLPEDKRAAAQLEIATRLHHEKEAQLEAQAKRIVIREKALEYGLDRAELEKLALNVSAPEDIDAIAGTISNYKKEVEKAKKRVVDSVEEPAIAGVRPDSGGQGSAPSRQDILNQYRGTGKIAEMREALRAAGY